jgi:hypothetical protein
VAFEFPPAGAADFGQLVVVGAYRAQHAEQGGLVEYEYGGTLVARMRLAISGPCHAGFCLD